MNYKPTQQQQDILDKLEDTPIVAVDAKAGTGKTSTSLLVVHHFKPKKGFYTAYNKSIVVEAQEKFPANMECKTKHAFALGWIKPKNRIEPFTYLCIKEKLSYPSKKLIMDVMGSFFLSASTDMEEYVSVLEDPKLEKLALKYINQMINDEIPPTFDFLLKYLHLLLDQELLEIKYDLVVLDEAQDTTAVFYEIFKLIKCDRKLVVGDPFQNIYGYMNTVNAFNLLGNVPVLPLTKTFRCSPEIAERVQAYGLTHLSDTFEYEGAGTNTTDDTIAYIGRTNGSILMRIYDIIEEGKSFTLTRPVKEILALPMALANVSNGREVYHKQYKYLEKEYQRYTISGMKSFYAYLMKYVEDEELHACIKFMNVLREKNINIFQLKKDIEAMVFDPKVWVVTAHSFKGREVGTVVIEESLNRSVTKIIEKGGPENNQDQEELNLGYVAVTRAMHTLKNCKFA